MSIRSVLMGPSVTLHPKLTGISLAVCNRYVILKANSWSKRRSQYTLKVAADGRSHGANLVSSHCAGLARLEY